MWKKLLVLLIALVGAFSVGYVYVNFNTEMEAAVAPSFQLPKGAKVVLGKYNNNEVVWDIGNNNNNGNYVLMSSVPIESSMSVLDTSLPIITSPAALGNRETSRLRYRNEVNMAYCPVTPLKSKINSIVLNVNETNLLDRAPFLPSTDDVKNGGTLGLTFSDRAYKTSTAYWLDGYISGTYRGDSNFLNYYFNTWQLPSNVSSALTVIDFDTRVPISNSEGIYWDHCMNANYVASVNALRPFAVMKRSNVLFAANISYTDGNWHEYKVDTANFNANNEANPNQLRIQSSLTASLQDIQRNSHSIQRVAKNSTVQLKVNANTGSNTKISVIIYDSTGTDIKYYRMLNSTSGGTNDYSLDLTSIPTGSYQIAVINEEYDSSSNLPVESSPISNLMPLEIVDPLSNLSFTPRTNLTYDSNVNVGDTVGTISSQNGAGTITYTIIADPSYPNEYQNLTLASDGKTVIVDGNPLNAGTYHFKIQAQDENNDPNPALTINASITVKQSRTTIAFDDPNQTKKSIIDAMIDWSETATAIPNGNDVKITYAKVSGDISLINIDPNTGAIRYTGVNAYGKVTIKATADDDPNTGNDNYDSVTTTKEVIIYRAVDGTITPDAQSSDSQIPTFSASDPNAKPNGKIATVQGMMGTPDDAISGTITYTYELKQVDDFGSFEVDRNTGEIKSKVNLGVQEHHITLIVKDKWSSKEIPLTIKIEQANAEDLQFYENNTSNIVINTKTVNFTDTNVSVYATVKNSSNTNPVMYQLKSGEPTNVIDIHPTSGVITIKGAGTVIIEATKQGMSGQSDARAELTFTVTAASQNFIYTTDSTLLTEMPKNAATGKYNPYEETYSPGKIFQVYTTGNPAGSSVTYQLKAGSSNDVISVDPDGTIHILNASRSGDIGHVTIEATSHDPSGNYTDKTIELPITINRGTRTVSFADDPIYAINGSGSVTPVIMVEGIPDTTGTAVIEVDPNESSTAWTNNGIDIQYSYTGDNGKDIALQVSLPGGRNYENATGTGTLHILGTNEAMLTVSTPGRIIYGDHFTIRSTQNDSISTNVQYSFTVDDTTYISNPTVNGNKAEFDALKYSGNTEITITVTRTADGEVPLSKKVKVKVLPKPITITIDDKSKLRGEANPPLTVNNFDSQLVSWNGVPDVIQPNDVKLSTTANQSSQVGSYPIKGDANFLNQTYPNYTFTFVEGTLKVSEENIEDSWYHMETVDGQAYNGDWTNQDVNIISDHTDYVNLSPDQSTWNPQQITVSREGNNEQSFWMKKNSGATTGEKKERIKIDKHEPKVKNIKAKDSNNKLQDIINKLSGGIFFKPGTTFEITTDDSNGQLDVSGTASIAYKIYKIEKQAKAGEELVKEDTLTVSQEKANITISETTGTYKVCVIPTDEAGNTGTETCHEATLKKINVDADEDDIPDFVDPDGDGCPDIDIVLGKDGDGKWIKLNIDTNGDKKPDLNIDTDGDGKADINVDQDEDGKADLNIVKVTKWDPSVCVNDQAEEYCTDADLIPNINVDLDGDERPDINIDLNQDGIPDIDIDTDGDGIADINIDEDKDGKADTNIRKMNDWKIDPQVFEVDGVKFQTMTGLTPDTNKELEDNGVKVENPDGEFAGNITLKVTDITKTKQDEVKEQAKDLLGEHSVIQVYDVKLLENGEAIEPNGRLRVKFPMKANIQNPQVLILNENGEYEKIDAIGEDGYLIVETDRLGQFVISGDIVEAEPDDTDVKSGYYPGDNMGGALTGDGTDIMMFMGTCCLALGMMCFQLKKYHEAKR